ncbi:hypothetical protein [Streptomyces sp. NBC_01233]|uniref:hypothetical protein n=1 Tax=Streptomyces sp. NBC_01233 TaxID=2903787 RepID=UPI002E13270B|nr:hypothetical protein OG332_00395 [Streptomyces sp. NBC_01233]WSP95283.1 hypothetical protein OG332_46590 [Streptomyces sp. NBC_01233]
MSRRSRASALGVLAAALFAFTGLCFSQGKTPGLLPESSWGDWRDEERDGWSTHVRVSTWSRAAQARIDWGKAEGIDLNAYGRTARDISIMHRTVFTLTPDGKLTAKRS